MSVTRASPLRLGGAGSMWGDALDPAVELAEHGDVSYLCFDVLAELTMFLFHRQRERDPEAGFTPDVVGWVEALLPWLTDGGHLVTNAGAANPRAGARAVAEAARRAGAPRLRVGAVTGDELTDRLDELQASGWEPRNLDTGEVGFDRIADRVVGAYAYVGADGIRDALDDGADVVLTGRASDTALYVGPVLHEFGWDLDTTDPDLIAAAIAMGHLLECSCCSTGGMSSQWERVPEPWAMGYPIAEFGSDGAFTISKVPGSGGLIDEWTVKEHLLYEIHDPRRYLMPDGVLDITSLALEDLGGDRVRLSGATGERRPDSLKAVVGYRDGWIQEGLLLVPWPDARRRAEYAGEIVRRRLERNHVPVDELRIDLIGVGALGSTAPGTEVTVDTEPPEVGLRIAARTPTRAAAEQVRRECSLLWIRGAVGTAFGVPMRPRPVIAGWPTLVPRGLVATTHHIEEV